MGGEGGRSQPDFHASKIQIYRDTEIRDQHVECGEGGRGRCRRQTHDGSKYNRYTRIFKISRQIETRFTSMQYANIQTYKYASKVQIYRYTGYIVKQIQV